MTVRNVPVKYRAMYKRAMSGESRKTAMQAFSAECVRWTIKEVKLCTDTGCPLYPYRQVKQNTDNSEPLRTAE